VLAVIIYHFNNNILPGGYLGVDMFFVISGYVITLSLASKKSKNFGDFLSCFYERRIRRLLPALALFVAISATASHLFIRNASQYYITGALALFGLSNQYIFSQQFDYWGLNSSMNPFTNTWSLGVEEQFYLLFPIIAWLMGFAQHKTHGARNLFVCISVLAVASAASYVYLYQINQAAAYFLMPFRFWEIAAGCLLFIGSDKISRIKLQLDKIPPSLVFISISCVMLFSRNNPLPATFLIVLLTSFLLLQLESGQGLFNLLTNKYVVYIGLISYSLYLWHWSVLSLARWTVGISKVTVLPLLIFIFALSIFSYEFIEKSSRGNAWSTRRSIAIAKGLLIAIGVSTFTLSIGSALKSKFYLGDIKPKDPPINPLLHSTFHVMGDSHGYDILELLKINGTYKVSSYIIRACRFYFNNSGCLNHKKNLNELIKITKPGDVVIFASNDLPYLRKDPEDASTMLSFFELVAPRLRAKNVLIILKLPHPESNSPNVGNGFICKKEFFRQTINSGCFVKGLPKNKFLFNREQATKALIHKIRTTYPYIMLWDISSVVCPGVECFPVTKDHQYFSDGSHLFLSSGTLSDALTSSLNLLLTSPKK